MVQISLSNIIEWVDVHDYHNIISGKAKKRTVHHDRDDQLSLEKGKQREFFSFFFSLISLIADGPHHYIPACGH